MKLHVPTAALVITLCGHQAYAQADLDELTPCSVAARAFSSHDERKIQQVSEFITQVLEKLDREHRQAGETAIPNDDLKTALVAATRRACPQHQGSTISIEASNIYRDVRRLLYSGREGTEGD